MDVASTWHWPRGTGQGIYRYMGYGRLGTKEDWHVHGWRR
jgi:hypothetical protein